MKVLITTNIPSPYFVDYANELSKYVDLTVVFELKESKGRDKKWMKDESQFKFRYYYLNAIKFNDESGLSFKIKKFLKDRSFDKIIIANPSTPTGVISLLFLNKHHIPFVIQSEGGFKGNGKGFKEKLKYRLFKNAEYYLTGMGGEDDYFMQYGATINRLYKYHFSSLKNKDLIKNLFNEKEKKKYKKQLNINFKNVILYVGQFIKRKDIPTLLKGFKGLDNKDTCLILVGGDDKTEYTKLIKDLAINNVIFIPFKNNNEVHNYYRIADIFVLPTKEDTWGLVINEAMAFGLPVISTNKSIAATQLIKNNENGYIFESGDFKSLNERLSNLINNNKLRNEMSLNNLNKIKDYTIEKMALEIFNYLSN